MSRMPSLAGPGETLHPLASPPGSPASAPPAWLTRLLRNAETTDPSWFSRFLPPDG